MSKESPGWSESASRDFLSFSDVITPSRPELLQLLTDLVPADPGDEFAIVELACGGGELAERLLETYPRARYLGLDGSETMLAACGSRVARFGDRVALASFRLEEFAARGRRLDRPARCLVSSLAIHHLDDRGKRSLYEQAYRLLEPGGALLVVDIVEPRSRRAVAALAANWDRVAAEQSLALTGSAAAFEKFRDEGWNYYSHPDPIDLPAPLFAQLRWLEAIGFRDVDCFWQRCGHALFGGYRSEEP